jgi:ribosomal protein S18 acetylase RimI-like enzyme
MIEYRRAVQDDYPAIAKLHAASWQQHYRGIFSDSYLDSEAEHDRMQVWKKRMLSPADNQYVTLAVQDGAIVGFACLFLDHDPEVGSMIDNLHVAKDCQRSGTGTKLMRICAEKIILDAMVKKMHLWVFELNILARGAYEKAGGKLFETVETENEDGTRAYACCYTWDMGALQLLTKG